VIKIEEKTNTLTKKHFTCPVCGGILSDKNLPDLKSVVDYNIYDEGNFKIVNSSFTIQYNFKHGFDEENDAALEEFHTVVVQIELTFDSTGECVVFDMVGVSLLTPP
jgi:hypothetical protein